MHCCIAKAGLFTPLPALYLFGRRQRTSSSQRSFIDWQHSSSQLPIRIKSPMHPPPASGSFFILDDLSISHGISGSIMALPLCNGVAN